MDKGKATEQLRRDEGEKLHAYQDHLGFWTIGVGRLIDQRKGGRITHAESDMLLSNDIDGKWAELSRRLPWAVKLNEARQGALLNMAFQLGVDGLLAFKGSLYCIENGMWNDAHARLLDSKWAKQTPERAERVARQIRDGEWV